MRRIGIVVSDLTVLDAGVILAEGEEKSVKAEDLVLIRNRNCNKIMAITRRGLGSNENLKTSNYSPGVAYARVGRHPSNAKEFYAFCLSFVEVSDSKLKENKMLIEPSSEVKIFEEAQEEFHVKATSDLKEIKELIEVGFQYVCEKNDLIFFRKQK